MKAISKGIKQNLLIQGRIKNASFVPTEQEDTKKFKYNLRFKINKYINKKSLELRAIFNKIIQRPRLWAQRIKFDAIKEDTISWLIEALIEGSIINFVVWILIGWRFNLMTALAWGFAIKELLSIYRRLRKDGSDPTVLEKDK